MSTIKYKTVDVEAEVRIDISKDKIKDLILESLELKDIIKRDGMGWASSQEKGADITALLDGLVSDLVDEIGEAVEVY